MRKHGGCTTPENEENNKISKNDVCWKYQGINQDEKKVRAVVVVGTKQNSGGDDRFRQLGCDP